MQSVNTDIENNVYKDAVIILHVFATLLAMAKDKIIERSVDDILSQARRYITNISPKLEYDGYDELEYRQSNLLQFNKTNLGIHQNNSTECQELVEILEKAIKIKIQINKTGPYHDMIQLLESDVAEFENWAHSEQGCKDIYSGQNPILLWNAWIKLSPKKFRDIVYCFSNSIVSHILHKYPNTRDF